MQSHESVDAHACLRSDAVLDQKVFPVVSQSCALWAVFCSATQLPLECDLCRACGRGGSLSVGITAYARHIRPDTIASPWGEDLLSDSDSCVHPGKWVYAGDSQRSGALMRHTSLQQNFEVPKQIISFPMSSLASQGVSKTPTSSAKTVPIPIMHPPLDPYVPVVRLVSMCSEPQGPDGGRMHLR